MTFDDLKKLRLKEHREERRLYLAEGEHLVLELARALPQNPGLESTHIFVTHEYETENPHRAWPARLPVTRLSAKQMATLSDTRTPQGVLAVIPMLPSSPPKAGERVFYLHEIQDPGNLGTILRTFGWFGNFRCLLSPHSADLYNSKVVRASMGAIFHVPVERDVSVESLCSRYKKLALLGLDGKPVSTPQFKTFDGYVFGNEARGLPREVSEQLGGESFSIPGEKNIESLNLASAVNICAYELTRS